MAMQRVQSKRIPPDNPLHGLRSAIEHPPAASGKVRCLTPKQLRLPFFSRALEVLSNISHQREKLLPRLLAWGGERRTRIEVYQALEAISSPMLARYDLATGILGWLDESGAFHLSNQGALARDSRLTPSIVNRLFKRLSAVGYVRRRIELVSGRANGERFIRTRVLIHFTDLFWRHLRLSLAHGFARRSARKRRAKKVTEAQAKNLAAQMQIDQKRKQTEKRNATFIKQRLSNLGLPSQTPKKTEAQLREFTDLLIQLKLQHPTYSAAEIREMAEEILSQSP